jgi:hypothetical protein
MGAVPRGLQNGSTTNELSPNISTNGNLFVTVYDTPPPNPRRAYDHDGREFSPMTLGNMREHGVGSVLAICQFRVTARPGEAQ